MNEKQKYDRNWHVDPTPEEIAAECEKIRDERLASEEEQRRKGNAPYRRSGIRECRVNLPHEKRME